MTHSNLRFDREGAVAIVTLTNAARMNPLSTAMQAELLAQLGELRADPAVRAIVLTGAASCGEGPGESGSGRTAYNGRAFA